MARSASAVVRHVSRSVKTRSGGNREIGDRRLHAGRVGIVDAGDLGVRMLGDGAQEVAHVHVVEVDAEDAVLGHSLLPNDYFRGVSRVHRMLGRGGAAINRRGVVGLGVPQTPCRPVRGAARK